MSIADFLPAAIKYLLNDPEFMEAAAPYLGRDQKVTQAYHKGWIFPGLTREGAPYRTIEGSGKCCIVLSDDSTWAVDANHTNHFPELQVLIYADVTRDADGNPVRYDAKDRALRLFELVEAKYHDPSNLRHNWDGFYVHSSIRASGPTVSNVFNGDAAVRLVSAFEIAID